MIISLLDLSRTPKPIWRTVSHFGETHCQGRRTPERDHHDNFFKPGPVAASLDICTESYSHMANGLPLWGDAMPGKETPSKQQRCIISLLDLYRTPDLMWRTVSPEGWHSAREGNAGTRWYKTFKIEIVSLCLEEWERFSSDRPWEIPSKRHDRNGFVKLVTGFQLSTVGNHCSFLRGDRNGHHLRETSLFVKRFILQKTAKFGYC